MTQLYISCKESRIENNRSFYGSFVLGPFEGGQSLTIANALRRTLLSELKGLAIVSIQIEGVLHEYSSIPGVKDSVLDILLNFKEIHFTSPFKNTMLPQVGYLCVRGPGVVRSSDLKLPPFIKLVDPDQYIATLAEDGFLNMKFIISEGKNYIISGNKIPKNEGQYKEVTSTSINSANNNTNAVKNQTSYSLKGITFNLRRSLLQKMGFILERDTKTINTSSIYNLKKRFLKLKKKLRKVQLPENLPNSNPLTIDSVFAPVTKVNYMIEYSEHKTIDTSFSNAYEINEILNFLKPLVSVNTFETSNPKTSHLLIKDNSTFGGRGHQSKLSLPPVKEILNVKNQLTSINISKDYVKPSTIKQNIIIEIWTNGSMHPRDALYQGLKNLVKVFLSLYQIGSLYAPLAPLKTGGAGSVQITNANTSNLNNTTLSPLGIFSTLKMSSLGLNSLKQKAQIN